MTSCGCYNIYKRVTIKPNRSWKSLQESHAESEIQRSRSKLNKMTKTFLCMGRIHFKSWSSEVKEVQYDCHVERERERRVTKGERN